MNSDKKQDIGTPPLENSNNNRVDYGVGGHSRCSVDSGALSPTNANGSEGYKKDDINLAEFLNLLNVSCHVNDMITASGTPNSLKEPTGLTKLAKPDARFDMNLEELAKNPLINRLLDQKSKSEVLPSCHDLTESSASTSSYSARAAKLKMASVSNTTRGEQLHPKLEQKLDHVIEEGMLDAVLSFICPVPVPSSFSKNANKTKLATKDGQPKTTNTQTTDALSSDRGESDVIVADSTSTAGRDRDPSKALVASVRSRVQMKKERKEPEVIIHVCDEVKNETRDFSCPQRLLVSKMGYFADVTAGQKLEEMDISVHCDIQIFDWLMNWVCCNDLMDNGKQAEPETVPRLDVNNVVPILVSASFLQMEPLLQDCLSFCHARLGEVVRASTHVSSLNDSIVTRLAEMFTNLELEVVRDKKDRLLPRLWIKLIQSLCEAEPEALRGHYYSLAGLFRCAKCGECLTHTFAKHVLCVPGNMRLNRWGQLVSHHVRDPLWDMNAYVAQRFKELKSWRRVYWTLWGHCHYLYCCLCESHFPVYQMAWCRFHPDNPNFLGPVSEDCLAGPAGRYPCCGQQAYRYDTLPGPNGCQYREHSVLVETERERQILQIVQIVAENNALCENPSFKLLEAIRSKDNTTFWNGISLTPQRCRQGLLPVLNPDGMAESTSKIARRARRNGAPFFADSSSGSETSDTTVDLSRRRKILYNAAANDDSFSTSSDGCESESSDRKQYSKKGKKRYAENSGRYWCGDMSARSNQDHQREYEEKVMKQVIALVNKKTGSEQCLTQNVAPAGGTYLRLEAEWKDQLKQRNSVPNISITSLSNNMPKMKK